MKKIVTTGFSYNFVNNEITFTDSTFDIRKLYSIVNVRTNKVYYSLGIKGYGYKTFLNNILKLQYIPDDYLPSDPLSIIYEEEISVNISDVTLSGWDPVENKLPIGNVDSFFREHFSGDFSEWDINADAGDFYYRMGNADGSSHLSIIKSQSKLNSITSFLSKKSFQLPARILNASSITIRTLGVDFAIDMIGVDSNGNVIEDAPCPQYVINNLQIISSATPLWILSFNQDIDDLTTGDLISINNCDNTLFNVGPISITMISRRSLSFSFGIAVSFKTYTQISGELGSNPFIKKIDVFNNARYGLGHSFNFNNSSYIRFSIRDQKALITNLITNATSVSSTTISGTYANKAFTYAIKPNSLIETTVTDRSVSWNQIVDGSVNGAVSLYKKHYPIPNESIRYKLRIKAENTGNIGYCFVANIDTISKVISTSIITIRTLTKHNLKRGNAIAFGGVVNTLHFPTSSSVYIVNSITDDFSFTVTSTINSTTISSNGGAIFLYNGSNSTITLINLNFTSYRITNNIVNVISPSTISVTVGIHYHIFGTQTALDGMTLRCCILNGQNVSFEIVSGTLPDTGLITKNFVLIIAQEFRVHLASVLDYNRNLVEVTSASGAKGDNDTALPVVINGSNTNVPVLVAGGTIALGGGSFQTLSYGAQLISTLNPLSNLILGTVDISSLPQRSSTSAVFLLNINPKISLEQSTDNAQWFQTDFQRGTLIEFPDFYFSSVTSVGSVRTLNLTNGHTLVNGMEVLINGISYIISNVRLNSFDISASSFSLTSGNIVVRKDCYWRIIFNRNQLYARYIRWRISNDSNSPASVVYGNYSLNS